MVSNVGQFGVDHGLAPLVPRTHVPIVLLLGRVMPRPVVVDGRVEAAPCMTVGCTFDHRLIDGFQAGSMECLVRETLEDPFTHLGPPTRSSSAVDPPRPDPDDTTSTRRDSNGYTVPTAGSGRNGRPLVPEGSS
ncbi:MAG: hypothetical protein E4H03_04435 [Myxococcales bacterium]|nr:MAG: hypothetical protein E4H03_04435 [Myxococcales bacterium]